MENADIRTELAKIAFKNESGVFVMTEPEAGAADVLKLVQKELAPKPIAIFGDNVFEKNYTQLKSIENVEFAVIKKMDDERKTEGAHYEIRAKDTTINSKDHVDVFRRSESTLDRNVNEQIIEKGYYQRFRVISCDILFAS